MDSPDHIIEVELLEVIGSTILATVHKARRIDTGEIVAIKSVRLDIDINKRDQRIKRLKNDCNSAAQLNHVNLIRHIHHQQPALRNPADAPIYQIIMEYCEGPTLHAIIQKFPMTPVILQKWTKEILEGLGYLHQQGLIHRDIKGKNIMMTSSDISNCRVKIVDLGDIKQLLNETTKSREVTHGKGTWAFMSPEMITGENADARPDKKIRVGRRTDVWSVGCVAIEMINGGLPHFHKSGNDGGGPPLRIEGELAVMYFVGSGGSPTIPSGLPVEVEKFIKECLTRDPKQRPTVAELQTRGFVTSAEHEVVTWILPPRGP